MPLRSLGVHGVFWFYHPHHLYLYLLSLYASLSNWNIFIARSITVLFALIAMALTFAIGQYLSNSWGGWIAATLLAVNPFFALYSFFVREEIPMMAAMLAGFYLLLQRRILWAGILLAIAALCKEVVVFFTACCVVYVWWYDRGAPHKCLRDLAALAGPTALAWGSWVLWAYSLSPTDFMATVQRWLSLVTAANLLDPRAHTSVEQWSQQIAFDLLGAAMVAGLLISLVTTLTGPKRRLDPEKGLLWGYLFLSLVISFVLRLKELRLLIGLLPTAALLIGTNLDWEGVTRRIRYGPGRLKRLGLVLAMALFLLSASPLRLPAGPLNQAASWLDPLYAWRLLENDRFYRVLRLAGEYLREHTKPDEVITVAHQATVVAYYADRHYYMLYTLSKDAIDAILARTRYLVWDDPTFLALTPSEVADLRQEIQERFRVEQVIRDRDREVLIYR
ncbi:MAG: glycosyltransferase family 39 protein [Anaerolineae bacterium]|nr:glycosyltransferase family 39 protein [Anaerolineae bacterium]MDW8100680.1 glycosyltransferase family 39 protein [Anaerolineae bacterium]